MSSDKPNSSKIFQWNETETNVIEPTASKKQNGWNPGEKAPAQYFNWLWNIVGVWVTFLNKLWEKGHDGTGVDTGGIGMTGKDGNAANNPLGENSLATGTSNIVSGDNSSASGVSNNVSGIRSYATGQANDVKSDNTIVSGDGNLSETSCNNSEISGQTCKNYGASNRVGGNNSEAGVSGVNPSTQSNIDCFGSNNKSEKSYSFVRGVSNIVSALYGFILGGQNNNVNGEGSGVLGADGITNDRYYNTTVNELTVSQGIYLPTADDESTKGMKNHVMIGGYLGVSPNDIVTGDKINKVGEQDQRAGGHYFNYSNCTVFYQSNLQAIYHYSDGNFLSDELGNWDLITNATLTHDKGLFGENNYSVLFSAGETGNSIYNDPANNIVNESFLDNGVIQVWVKKPANTNAEGRKIVSKYYSLNNNIAWSVNILPDGTLQVEARPDDSSSSTTANFNKKVDDEEYIFLTVIPTAAGVNAAIVYSDSTPESLENNRGFEYKGVSVGSLDTTNISGYFEVGEEIIGGSFNPMPLVLSNMRIIKGETLGNLSDNPITNLYDKEKVILSAAQRFSINFNSVFETVGLKTNSQLLSVTNQIKKDEFHLKMDDKDLFVKPFLGLENDNLFVGLK